ncbi:PAS domain S-box protein [ANME-2 cluster archaeon]|nr:MAG: PAS domain S-box protein [ANME-2 cluster archaeon]
MGERRWHSSKMAQVFDTDGSVATAVCVGRDVTERKAAEEAMRTDELEKVTILNSLSEHVLYQDAEMRILWANRAAGESVGLTPDELVGRHCYEIWHQRSEPCAGCPVRKTHETGQTQEGEMTTPDGRVWFIRSDPVRDADGNIVGAVETTLEITERKRAENALQESEERLDSMLQSIGDHISMMDRDLNIIWANKTAMKIFGNNIIGKKCYEVYHRRKEPCEPHPCLTLRTFQDGRVHEHDTQVMGQNGEMRYFHCTANVALKDNEGKPAAVIEISRDITQCKLTEEALRKSAEQLRETKDYLDNIIESSADAIVVVDMDGTVRSWNKAAEDYMGYAADEVIGSSNRKFFADPEEPERIMEMVLRDGMLKNYRTAVLNNDRKPVQISLSASLLKDSEGVPIGTVRVSRDITKEVELEARIKEERDNLNLIFDSMVDGIYIVSKDYEIEFMNKVLIGEFGDRVGTICYKAFHNREEPCPLCKNQEVMNGETVHWEWNSGRRNRTYDLIETPLKNIDGTISKLTIFRDITERKRAEEKLLRVSRDREEIFQALGNAVIIIDPEFNILDANRPVMAATGMSAKELTGRKCYEIAHRTTEPPENCPAKKLMASKDYKPVENDMEALGGIFLVSCTPVIEDGDLVKIIHTMADITERKRAEEKLEKKIEELRRFNEMTVERELKMVELKKEINSLLRGVGKEPRYRILEEIDTGTSE